MARVQGAEGILDGGVHGDPGGRWGDEEPGAGVHAPVAGRRGRFAATRGGRRRRVLGLAQIDRPESGGPAGVVELVDERSLRVGVGVGVRVGVRVLAGVGVEGSRRGGTAQDAVVLGGWHYGFGQGPDELRHGRPQLRLEVRLHKRHWVWVVVMGLMGRQEARVTPDTVQGENMPYTLHREATR